MNNLKVSIITVSYNSVNTIERTIQSVISQTYDNIEYIIIDGCSTDNTQEIIRRYESHISYWVSEADGGIYDAMNKGIKHATGDIIGILNSDDRYHSDHIIETIVNKYSCSDCPCIIHGDICYFTSDNSSFILKPITRQDQIRKEGLSPCYVNAHLPKDGKKPNELDLSIDITKQIIYNLGLTLADIDNLFENYVNVDQ